MRAVVQVKAQADGKAAGASAGELGPVNFGPKYEQHVQELQKQLDDASAMCSPSFPTLLHPPFPVVLLIGIQAMVFPPQKGLLTMSCRIGFRDLEVVALPAADDGG